MPVKRPASRAPKRPTENSPLIEKEKFWSDFSHFPPDRLPKFGKLRLPPKLSDVSGRKLGNLMSRYASQSAYFDELVARAEIDFAICKQNVGYLRSKLLLRASGRTIDERRAYRSTRKVLVNAKNELLKARATYVMLLTYRRTCDKYYQCVSREVSRREAEYNRSRG